MALKVNIYRPHANDYKDKIDKLPASPSNQSEKPTKTSQDRLKDHDSPPFQQSNLSSVYLYNHEHKNIVPE